MSRNYSISYHVNKVNIKRRQAKHKKINTKGVDKNHALPYNKGIKRRCRKRLAPMYIIINNNRHRVRIAVITFLWILNKKGTVFRPFLFNFFFTAPQSRN